MDDRKGRRWHRRHMLQRVAEIAGSRRPHELDPDWSKIRRGWCLGEPSFREKLLEHLDHVQLGKKATGLCGPEIHCHNKRRVAQLEAKSLKAVGLTEESLKMLPKGCPEKQVLVWFIHTRTSVPNDWLCQQLHCGHSGNISKYAKAVALAEDKQIVTLKKRIPKSGCPLMSWAMSSMPAGAEAAVSYFNTRDCSAVSLSSQASFMAGLMDALSCITVWVILAYPSFNYVGQRVSRHKSNPSIAEKEMEIKRLPVK